MSIKNPFNEGDLVKHKTNSSIIYVIISCEGYSVVKATRVTKNGKRLVDNFRVTELDLYKSHKS